MKIDILPDSQMDKIYKELINPWHKRYFAIARYTGAKTSEILGLLTCDVYSDLLIPLSSISFINCDGLARSVSVSPKLESSLFRYRPKDNSSKWLFPSHTHRGDHVKLSSIDKAFRAALYRAELDGKGISLRDIRQAFVYTLLESGIREDAIAQIIGTRKIADYRKAFQNFDTDLSGVLSRIFN